MIWQRRQREAKADRHFRRPTLVEHARDTEVLQVESDEARHQRTEAYVLGTACTLAGREMSSIPFGGGRIGSRIDEAIRLEPKNPRVRLVEALVAFDRAGKDGSAKSAAVQKLRAVTEMFEAARAGAASVEVWGSGTPRREFIYVDDLADACVFAMDHYQGTDPINLGTGVDTAIGELAREIARVVGYRGEIRFDRSKPDGMPFKGLDSSVLHGLGWRPQWTLARGLEETYRWYSANVIRQSD